MSKTYYLWDLADTLFPERWDSVGSGCSDIISYMTTLGYDQKTITPGQFELAYEQPYRKGFFALSLIPGFTEVLPWAKHNGYFTSGHHEQNLWRNEQIQKKYHINIFDYIKEGFSAFDFGSINQKTAAMFTDILNTLHERGYTDIVYTDDKETKCELFFNAITKLQKEGVRINGRTYHRAAHCGMKHAHITDIRDLFELRDKEAGIVGK